MKKLIRLEMKSKIISGMHHQLKKMIAVALAAEDMPL